MTRPQSELEYERTARRDAELGEKMAFLEIEWWTAETDRLRRQVIDGVKAKAK